MSTNNKYDKCELETLILTKKLSYEKIGKIYNCTGSNIKKIAFRMGICLPIRRNISLKETFNKGITSKIRTYCLNCSTEITFKTGNKFCSTSCWVQYKSLLKYNDFLANGGESKPYYVYRWLKPIILKEQDNKCAICECENIHNKKQLIFVLDHIDGNATNNVRSNYRLICPNCDSQLDTFKSKNKNSPRHYHRYRYKGK